MPQTRSKKNEAIIAHQENIRRFSKKAAKEDTMLLKRHWLSLAIRNCDSALFESQYHAIYTENESLVEIAEFTPSELETIQSLQATLLSLYNKLLQAESDNAAKKEHAHKIARYYQNNINLSDIKNIHVKVELCMSALAAYKFLANMQEASAIARTICKLYDSHAKEFTADDTLIGYYREAVAYRNATLRQNTTKPSTKNLKESGAEKTTEETISHKRKSDATNETPQKKSRLSIKFQIKAFIDNAERFQKEATEAEFDILKLHFLRIVIMNYEKAIEKFQLIVTLNSEETKLRSSLKTKLIGVYQEVANLPDTDATEKRNYIRKISHLVNVAQPPQRLFSSAKQKTQQSSILMSDAESKELDKVGYNQSFTKK